MSKDLDKPKDSHRAYPKLKKLDDENYDVECSKEVSIKALVGMRTLDAAHGVYVTAISALGKSADKYGNLVSAMFAEMEPNDAVEAMLIAQMTATHVAMTTLIGRMTYNDATEVRESLERSTTRLSRTYLSQMDALKKYRAKAQQTVRVERVTVNDGGQAIVGDVCHQGGAEHEK
jgi:hypothetical protein